MKFFLTILYIWGCLCMVGVLDNAPLKPIDKVARVVFWPLLIETFAIDAAKTELVKP